MKKIALAALALLVLGLVGLDPAHAGTGRIDGPGSGTPYGG